MSLNVFDCYNENRKNPLKAFNCFMDLHGDFTESDEPDPETYINGHIYQKDIIIEEVDVVLRIIRKSWCILQNAILNDTTISFNELTKLREQINKCLKLIVECLKCCDNDILKHRYLTATVTQVKTFSSLILPLFELEKNIYVKLTSPSSHKEKCPIYQYFHTFQDVQYYLLLIDHISGNMEELKQRLHCIIKDLVLLSEPGYRQKNKSAFVCDCNKHFWLIIQLLCEKILGDDSFWSVFNKEVENLNSEYILWLMQDVANLQAVDPTGKYVGGLNPRIKPNFTLLESSLKKVISSVEFTDSILPTLKAIEPLVCHLWLKSSKIEVFQMLWDYFSKRLNISTRNSTNLTLTELVDLTDTILWAGKDCEHDFELFLAMLSVHLNEHPYHWGKMKGRIYSQLGPNKVKDLNNVGIFHVLLLFLSLTKVNFEELSKKFLSFIENLPPEKKQSQLIWSFYNSFVVRHIRENRSIEPIAPPFIKMSEEASTDQKLFHLIKIFVSDFDNIIKFSTNLQLHQWLLVNSWIHQYMTTCYYPDLVTLLNVLLSALERISQEHVWCDWELSFKNFVYPTLKYVAASRSAPEVSGTLAGKIAVQCPGLMSEAFMFFNGETIAPKVSANFLCVILDDYPNSFIMSSHQENVSLQTWVKFCLLTRDSYEELTRNIIKLDVIPQFIKTAIASTKDPLCGFIECLSENIKQHLQSPTVTKLCEIFFGQAERWISQYLLQPDNEGIVLRIYTCIGLAFYKIGPLLYNKHKSNCPYARLVSSILLPTELMIGKALNTYILQSVKKTWHLFFAATVKLNSQDDAFIERIMRELVVRYVPHFAVVDSPMLKCLDNEATAEVILDKMSTAFFKQPTKEAESNIFKSLRLINEFIQATTSANLLKLVVNKTLYGLFEVVMFHNQRNVATSVIKNITSSALYPQVKGDFEEMIVQITEKHLAFNTQNYFQLLGNVAKLSSVSVKNVIPRIKQHISNVERMRGVGYDKNLRLSLERLEASLLQMS